MGMPTSRQLRNSLILGVVIILSSYPVFMFSALNAEKCALCGRCIEAFPNEYYFMSIIAGSMIVSISGYFITKKNIVLELASAYFISLFAVFGTDLIFGYIKTRYPIRLLTYTVVLCTAILLIKLLYRYLFQRQH